MLLRLQEDILVKIKKALVDFSLLGRSELRSAGQLLKRREETENEHVKAQRKD